jgi:hypothetical protein
LRRGVLEIMRILLSFLSFCTLSFAGAVPADDRAELEDLHRRIIRLESGLRQAEAIRAVKRLQYSYGHFAELGLWHDLADLFADKGAGHYPAGELGKEGIRKLFLQEVGKGKLGLAEGQFYPHIMLQPLVTLSPDGNTGRGRWRVLAMLGSYGGTALWAGGFYENEYILENGVWKINDLHYYGQFTGRYEQSGWTVDKGAVPLPCDPAHAGTSILDTLRLPTSAKASPESLKTLADRFQDLERRAQRLNDEDEVENLQHIYGYYVDRKMWDDAADLFADDGTMELGLQGVYVGKSSIRRALNQFGPQGLREGELNDHLQFQTVVNVAPIGGTAKARGVELTMSGISGVGGQWGESIYENEYIIQNGIWRIKVMHVYPRLITDYDKGWAKDAKPAPGPNKDFPPDRPSTQFYEIFPKFFIPPFHFNNPVTGATLQYPGARSKSLFDVSPTIHYPVTRWTVASLAKRIAGAERLLKKAVAFDAAENLASAYGYYLDEAMWDETADLFALNARRNLSSIGSDTGREQIRKSIKSRYPGGKSKDFFTAHQIVQPVIHVASDGQSAKMRVRLFQLGGVSGGNGFWIAGSYETETVIEDGVWKFQAMDLDYTWTANYKGGWAHVDSDTKGIIAAPFPKILDLPFHYRNSNGVGPR